MILIADAGASKTDWRLIESKEKIQQFVTGGINPNHQEEENIARILKEELLPKISADKIKNLFYYGAGVSTDENRTLLKNIFSPFFPKTELSIEHDILGAARAVCGHKEGMAGILGTGSNFCVYDGEKITAHKGGWGYIIGDEGSGAHLGKLLLQMYINEELPKNLVESFSERYGVTWENVKHNLYKEDSPNRWLAQFAPFVRQNLKVPIIHQLAYLSFLSFFEKTVLKIPNCRKYSLGLVGSVAFYFSDVIKKVAQHYEISIGIIVEKPIAGLTLYHLDEKAN